MSFLTQGRIANATVPSVQGESQAAVWSKILSDMREVGRWLSRPSNRLEQDWFPAIAADQSGQPSLRCR